MNKSRVKRLKYNITFLVIIIFIEIFIIGSKIINNKEESLYFDGMNAISYRESSYVSVGSNNDNMNHFEKAKISKYNEKKEKTFEKLYNVGYNSAYFGVGIDKEDIIAVGSYEKNKNQHDNSIRKALIVKYNSDGDVVFEKDYSYLDNSKYTDIEVIGDGYIVAGQSVYKNTKIGSKEGGAILVKYSRDGKLLWTKKFGNNKSAIFNDLIVLDNYIYAVGVRDSYIGVICKYDMEGTLINYQDYLYTDELGFTGISTYNGEIYVSGSRKEEDKLLGLIVKYDKDIIKIDEKTYLGSGKTRFHKLIFDKDNIIVIGIVRTNKNYNNNKSADVFNYDGIIGKYTSSLEEIGINSYGDERDDYFTGISLVNDEYLVVGYSSYEDGSYLSKFIRYSDALKVLEVS